MTPADKAVPRMDEELERLVGQIGHAAQMLLGGTHVKILPLGEIQERTKAYDDALNALRLRIAHLISEARAEGAQEANLGTVDDWRLNDDLATEEPTDA